MAGIAQTMGVPDSGIVVEGMSQNTWQNIGCSMPQIKNIDRIYIVSDSLHSHRGKRYLCRQNPQLCASVKASGYYEPFASLLWKIPAAYHELRAWVRDKLIYEKRDADNVNTCPEIG